MVDQVNHVNVSTLPASGYLDAFARLLQQVAVSDDQQVSIPFDSAADRAVQLILAARARGNKLLLIGNGGSAAIVSHLHNDLTKGVGVRALVFNEQPLLTALANDEGYASVFERPIELWADAGDMLIAVSSSGSSPNIVRGAQAALAAGATVVTLSGFSPSNPLRGLGHLNLYVPSSHYGLVEQAHSVLTHYLSDAAGAALGSVNQGCASRDERELQAA
jgi:D-sedoheptulose 7-phosphate isomerase